MIINILDKNNIFYQFQYKLDSMGKKSYDFYIPDVKLIIECQGEQHFIPVNFRKNNNGSDMNDLFNKRIILDSEKYDMALKNGINIVYFTLPKLFKVKDVDINLPFYSDKNVFKHTDDLLTYINDLEINNNMNENIVSFKNDLLNISNDFIYQNGSFINKNYKIYLIKCHPNERDTLNSIARYNRKRDYKSIFIFEDEWFNNKEIIKNKLKHLFNKNTSLPKVGGRKLIVYEINKQTSSDFLNKFHIQGNGQGSLVFGAYLGDKLIAVMSFKTLIKGSNKYDLTRFASDSNYICQGVGSKILSYFVKNYKPESIISFADKRWTLDKKNNLYTNLGFKLILELYPDYKYCNANVDKYRRSHKFGFRKQILHKKYGLDLSLTETEMVKILGYNRIWDCGLLKYKIEIKKES